jgi:predicted helicase
MTRRDPTTLSKTLQNYYRDLEAFAKQNITHETAVRSAFQNLLADTARAYDWMLIPELGKKGARRIIPDGTLRDINSLPRGYWEAKDSKDKLDVEISKKTALGYPLTNIIFEDTREGVLYQNGEKVYRANLSNRDELSELLLQFFSFTEPEFERFDQAVEDFKLRVPDLAAGLAAKIQQAHQDNKRFISAYETFFSICTGAIDPNISRETVDEMLVQHLLTERLIRTIFDKAEFTQQNVIAIEVERVISALASKSFSRKDYLKSLDRFYLAIEGAAATLPHFSDKQHFLNTVYERFFQGYSVKQADTHGIVYTPQPIVDFMCESVESVLKHEFSSSLHAEGVNILDPCTGTGNFVVNLLNRVPRRDLTRIYESQLFANEIMLLPYYIATLNIEHAYYERTHEYRAFEGLCFVDTLDLAEARQTGFSFMTEANTERVKRQRTTPITVIIGNPPYNAGQQNENENNKNRDYKVVDKRIRETYAKDSDATLKNKLYDPYVRFFRWAIDRLGDKPGIICFVSNNSFIGKRMFGGMQKHLLNDFTRIYHVDLHGDVRENPKISGTAHNVFGIQTGVGITLAVKHQSLPSDGNCLFYHRVPNMWRREEKLSWLAERKSIDNLSWEKVPTGSWLTLKNAAEYDEMIPFVSKEGGSEKRSLFAHHSLGVSSNRDGVVYDFNAGALTDRVEQFVDDYNAEVDRYRRKATRETNIDDFVDTARIKWSRSLKQQLMRRKEAAYNPEEVRRSLWRPFTKKYLYLGDILVDFPALARSFFPYDGAENRVICCTNHTQVPFIAQMTDLIPDAAVGGRGGHCFPFYIYTDANTRVENVTDWSLEQFRKHYGDPGIGKWDIFHYAYGVLHSPRYREEFAANLKKHLPRIPMADSFTLFRDAGKELSELHVGYEALEPYPLQFMETASKDISHLVTERMKLLPGVGSIVVNESLTLADIPSDAHRYKLGNRSALEWLVTQFFTDEDDPNREDDEEYIVRLIGQVVRVSVETVKITDRLNSE